MRKLILTALASLFAANMVLAQAPAAAEKKATPQQEKMKACNADAKGKKGDERKAFMKECLGAKPAGAQPAAAEKKATPQQGKMKACNADAGEKKLKGDERKAFMKECLSSKK